MRNTFCILTLVLWLCGCGQSNPAGHLIQTQFLETSGLTVIDSSGESQQLIENSLHARAVVSPSGQWIAVEDMKMSDLVVVRLFRRHNGRYQELELPELRQHWMQLAEQGGIPFEDLIRPRVNIDNFGPSEKTLLLRFQAEAKPRGGDTFSNDSAEESDNSIGEEIDDVFAIPLERNGQ